MCLPLPQVAWWHYGEDDEQELEAALQKQEEQQEGEGEEGAAGLPEALPAAALPAAAPAGEPGNSAEAVAAASAGMAALAVTGTAAEVKTPVSSKKEQRPKKSDALPISPSDALSLRRSERQAANKAKPAQ